MAGIDKIYGTQEQHDEFRAWCEINNPDLLRYFYLKNGYKDRQRPITNFSTEADIWVWENCPIAWVKDRIREQYNGPPSVRGVSLAPADSPEDTDNIREQSSAGKEES